MLFLRMVPLWDALHQRRHRARLRAPEGGVQPAVLLVQHLAGACKVLHALLHGVFAVRVACHRHRPSARLERLAHGRVELLLFVHQRRLLLASRQLLLPLLLRDVAHQEAYARVLEQLRHLHQALTPESIQVVVLTVLVLADLLVRHHQELAHARELIGPRSTTAHHDVAARRPTAIRSDDERAVAECVDQVVAMRARVVVKVTRQSWVVARCTRHGALGLAKVVVVVRRVLPVSYSHQATGIPHPRPFARVTEHLTAPVDLLARRMAVGTRPRASLHLRQVLQHRRIARVVLAVLLALALGTHADRAHRARIVLQEPSAAFARTVQRDFASDARGCARSFGTVLSLVQHGIHLEQVLRLLHFELCKFLLEPFHLCPLFAYGMHVVLYAAQGGDRLLYLEQLGARLLVQEELALFLHGFGPACGRDARVRKLRRPRCLAHHARELALVDLDELHRTRHAHALSTLRARHGLLHDGMTADRTLHRRRCV